MLVTSGCWWLYFGDNFRMFVTEFRYWWHLFGCWCPTLMLKYRGCWLQNRPKPSATSQSCRLHISFPTSVANIDVASTGGSCHQHSGSIMNGVNFYHLDHFEPLITYGPQRKNCCHLLNLTKYKNAIMWTRQYISWGVHGVMTEFDLLY